MHMTATPTSSQLSVAADRAVRLVILATNSRDNIEMPFSSAAKHRWRTVRFPRPTLEYTFAKETLLPAYLVVEHIITDAVRFEEYRTKVAPMIAKHGGRYLTKGGSHKFPRVVIGNPSGS